MPWWEGICLSLSLSLALSLSLSLSLSLYYLLTWRADSIALGLARGVMAALTATDSELAQGLLC